MRTGKFWAFTGGLITGGVLVCMLAPKSRSEMCANLRKKMDVAKKRMDMAVEKCHSGSCTKEENSDNLNKSDTFKN